MLRVLSGVLCALAAIVCAGLLLLLKPDFAMAFALLGGAFFFVGGAYASFFRPQNWKNMLSWGATAQPPRNVREFIQNNGIAVGIAIYLGAVGVFALLISALGPSQVSLAIVLTLPIGVAGLAMQVWSWALKFRARKSDGSRNGVS